MAAVTRVSGNSARARVPAPFGGAAYERAGPVGLCAGFGSTVPTITS